MADTEVVQWQTVNDSNSTVNGINIATGCPPADLNQAIRAVMGASARLMANATAAGVVSGANGVAVPLPGGYWLQMGTVVVTLDANGTATANFPMPFPNGVVTCLLTNGDASAHQAPVYMNSASFPNKTAFGINVPGVVSTTYRVNYAALGN